MKPLLLVDGYNVIGAWRVPKEEHLTIEEARERLVHLVADYAGYSGQEVIVVFDGLYTDRPVRSHSTMHGVEVVFTRHGESADNYIEAACEAAPRWRQVRVATSDGVEQTVTMGRGAIRISSREFLLELTQTRSVGAVHMKPQKVSRGDIFSRLTPEQRAIFDRMRKGEDEPEVPKKAGPKKTEKPEKPTEKPKTKLQSAEKQKAETPKPQKTAKMKGAPRIQQNTQPGSEGAPAQTGRGNRNQRRRNKT